ncbi:ParB/RepB/Spo0J family partition protein [Chromobacterium sp. ASV23]|uniref:ParB/RepB/Spo0J family partition protein n=1 Tax=Chromobacterium sp. ASV23 TaxID=2795110 RepID=UPI0018EBF70E|nr:ParB/RepB/Spo0J family partition protein [Chromobacterium sp. ASV23]
MDKIKQLSVNPNTLTPNPWNTNHCTPDAEQKIRNSIKRFGLFKPIIVRELADGTLQILGGEHRWRAALDLGLVEVPIINLGRIHDRRAKEIGLVDNGRYGEDNMTELALLLKELGADEVAEFMPYTDADLTAIFSTETINLDDLLLPDETPEDPEIPEPSAAPAQTHQLLRFKVPFDDADRITAIIEKVMRDQGYTDEDSLSNAGNALVHLLLGAA